MNTIYFDNPTNGDKRREEIYNGQIYTYSPCKASLEFVAFAKSLIEEAFGGLDPITAQYHLPVEKYVAILSKLKPTFIHHPESKKFLQAMLREKNFDPELTYFDVPRMRSSTSDGYLTSGIAYAFHAHRDTWYSAPMCQINWWLPIYEVESGNVMAIHPKYFNQPIKNGSASYNYQEWAKTSRLNAANHIKEDTRVQPHPEEPLDLAEQLRVVSPPGGMTLFSAQHLHSSVANTTGKTRFSIDLRTVHLGDLRTIQGAKNIDAGCTGTTMMDYLRVSDLQSIPEEVIEAYMNGNPNKLLLASVDTSKKA
ncbi:MAG: hypothetical protein ACI8P3_001480 [Saprospiraceae bacterium]|jgi:hypothetical protein